MCHKSDSIPAQMHHKIAAKNALLRGLSLNHLNHNVQEQSQSHHASQHTLFNSIARYDIDQPVRQTENAMLLQCVHQVVHGDLRTLQKSEDNNVGMYLPWQASVKKCHSAQILRSWCPLQPQTKPCWRA